MFATRINLFFLYMHWYTPGYLQSEKFFANIHDVPIYISELFINKLYHVTFPKRTDLMLDLQFFYLKRINSFT